MQPQVYAPQQRDRPAWRRALGALAALGVLAVKFAAKLKALLLLLPKLKLFTTSASMLVSRKWRVSDRPSSANHRRCGA